MKPATLLDISGSPLHCNCDVKWVKQLDGSVSDIRAVCITPSGKSGQNVVDISNNVLKCSAPLLVIILPSSPVYVNTGGMIALSCEADGDPAPDITWTAPDGTTFTRTPEDISAATTFYNLTVTNAVVAHDEVWTCRASNSKDPCHSL